MTPAAAAGSVRGRIASIHAVQLKEEFPVKVSPANFRLSDLRSNPFQNRFGQL